MVKGRNALAVAPCAVPLHGESIPFAPQLLKICPACPGVKRTFPCGETFRTQRNFSMKLFRLPRHNPDAMAGETPLMRVARYIIIGLLLAGAVWGFWANSRRISETLKKKAPERAARAESLVDGQHSRSDDFSALLRKADGIAP